MDTTSLYFDWESMVWNNQFLWAALAAGSLVVLREAPGYLVSFMIRIFTYKITVYSEDTSAFQAVNAWLMAKDVTRYSTRFRVMEIPCHEDEAQKKMAKIKGAIVFKDAIWVLSPSLGRHFFMDSRIPLFIEREEKDSPGQYSSRRLESISIYLPRKKSLKEEYIREVKQMNDVPQDQVCIHSYFSYEQITMTRDKFPSNKLVYPVGFYEDLYRDMAKFLTGKKIYREKNLHWHRGYGFFGQPGTGKTSMIVALASAFDLEIHKFQMKSVDPSRFLSHFYKIQRGILVFEDLDLMLSQEQTEQKEKGEWSKDESGMDYHALLNVFDGLDTPEGVIFIVTSNKPDDLEPALLRPGRIDKQVNFPLMGSAEAQRYLSLFYGSNGQPFRTPKDLKISPAHLRNLCLTHEVEAIESHLEDKR